MTHERETSEVIAERIVHNEGVAFYQTDRKRSSKSLSFSWDCLTARAALKAAIAAAIEDERKP
mgnify:FL=1